MALTKLDKAEWKGLFDHISKLLTGSRAEIEAASLDLGDQIAVEWLTFLGITYDHKDEIIEIVLESPKRENIDHLIHGPREVYVDTGNAGVRRMAIVDRDNLMQIVTLRDPLLLPPPTQSAGHRTGAR